MRKILYWMWFLCIWFFNIYDLILGQHFYKNNWMVIILNVFMAIALFLILSENTVKEKSA